MSHSFDLCERGKWPFFSISGSELYLSSYLFRMWLLSMLWCKLTITHFFISLSSSIIILFFHFTHLILFLSFFILFDVWLGFSIHTLFLLIRCVHSFIITFRVGTPRSGTHDIFYALHLMHKGYMDYIIGIFVPCFLSFLSPYYLGLCYVPRLKTTLRPWLQTLCLTAHTWAILRVSWRLFLRAWWMRSYDMIYTGVYPFLSVMDFWRWYDLYWGIPHSSMTISFGMTPNIGA